MIITFVFHVIYNFRNINNIDDDLLPTEHEGLTNEEVNRLPKLKYSKAHEKFNECAVCLDNFQMDEECV